MNTSKTKPNTICVWTMLALPLPSSNIHLLSLQTADNETLMLGVNAIVMNLISAVFTHCTIGFRRNSEFFGIGMLYMPVRE
jgi:hypothetical protein